MHLFLRILAPIVLFTTALVLNADAQPRLVKDYQTAMEIPALKELSASPAHLYALSEDEGLAVFRTSSDTLEYLYTNPGMEKRGNRIVADVRFAYLFGHDDNRLTVIEPTSILGVYSSTYLPSYPLDVHRIGSHLLIALENDGLGLLSLASEESVDQEPKYLIEGVHISSLAGGINRVYALIDHQYIQPFRQSGDTISADGDSIRIENEAERLFYTNNRLWASDDEGRIYQVDSSNGEMTLYTRVDELPERMEFWNDLYVIRTEEGQIWLMDENQQDYEFRRNGNRGNYFAVTKSMLWMSEDDEVLQLHKEDQLAELPDETELADDEEIQLASIDDIVIPHPRPVLIPLQLENDVPADDIRFRYRSSVDNAEIRGNGFYWQPSANQTGRHYFTIVASTRDGRTDSTSFEIDVRRFNAPPRFSPVRPITISAGEDFSLPIEAHDPDGTHPDLIRYIGVDLPEGAEIDEHTGEFTWTPHRRQVGEHSFEVIATDQYGAASNLTVDITVKEIERD